MTFEEFSKKVQIFPYHTEMNGDVKMIARATFVEELPLGSHPSELRMHEARERVTKKLWNKLQLNFADAEIQTDAE